MNSVVAILERGGALLLAELPRQLLISALVLAVAMVADRVLARRVSAGWRALLYWAVVARAVVPVAWQTPLGLLRTGAAASGGSVELAGPVLVASAPAAEPALGAAGWLAMVYVVVAVSLAVRWARARLSLRRQVAVARPGPDELAASAGAPVVVHPTLGPLVAGILRPVVVLPAPLLDAPAMLTAVLAHEAAHVRRRDGLTAAVAQLACIVAWPVLPVWIAARQLRTLAELASDESALAFADSDRRRSYGETLLALADGQLPVRAHPLTPAFAWELGRRIRALRFRRRWGRTLQALVAALPALALFACSNAETGEEPAASTLPAVTGKPAEARRDPVLTVTKEGHYYLGTRRIDPANLDSELRAALGVSGGRTLLLRGDKTMMTQAAQDLMTVAKRAGAANIALLSDTPRSSEVMPGQAVVAVGGLDANVIRRIVRRHLNDVKWCYEQELARTPGLAGRVAVTFTIGEKGTVTSSALESSTVANPALELCVVTAVPRWEFPKPPGGGTAVVTYPFSFTPGTSQP